MEQQKYVYILVTQSGTGVSKMLRWVTHDPYNHVSLALDANLQKMYSYGRRRLHNPLVGGFVHETPQTGVFAYYKDTDAVVVRLPLHEEVYKKLEARMREMYRHRKEYHYDFLGVMLAYFGKTKARNHKSYCSKFVAGELQNAGVTLPQKAVYRPVDFLELGGETVFSGKLREYKPKTEID